MSDNKLFTISEVYKSAWKTFSENVGSFIKFYIITFILGIVYFVLSVISFTISLASNNSGGAMGLSFLVGFVYILALIFISYGFIYVILNLLKGIKPTTADFFYIKPQIFSIIVASILVFPLLLIAYLLLIVPGIYLSIRFSMISNFVIDKNYGPIQAIKASWSATKNQVWNLFVLGLANVCLNIFGFATSSTGVTLALTTVIDLTVYKKLEAAMDLSMDDSDPVTTA